MSEDNKALVRGFYDDINRGAVDAFMAKLADDFVGRAIVAAVRGVLGIFNANKAHSE